MKNLIIIYSDQKQLKDFFKATFDKDINTKCEIFSYKQLSVICAPAPIFIDSQNSVIVLLDITDENINIKNAAICILSSENSAALKVLKNKNIPCLTCGNGTLDSISLSSITEEKIIICQQRNIKTIDGKILEAREFPIERIENVPIETLLLASATRAVIEN